MAADQKWLFATAIKGIPGAAHLPSLLYSCCQQNQPASKIQPGVFQVDHMVLHHLLSDSRQIPGLWQLLHSKNHQLADRRICDSANNIYSRILLVSSLPLYGWGCPYMLLLPSTPWRRENKRVPKKRNDFLSLSASSSDKNIASDYGQDAAREMNNLRDATHDVENIKEQTMKMRWKLQAEHFSEAEGKLQEIKLVVKAKCVLYCKITPVVTMTSFSNLDEPIKNNSKTWQKRN